MSDRDPVGTEADKALWARFKATAPAAPAAAMAPVFDDDLAAWLDGRLPAADAARVEARLAADPSLLDLALDAAHALRAYAPAPERLVVRAQALAGFEAERRASPGGLRAWLSGWRRSFEMALVAGAFLIVCATGFSLGGGFQESYASTRFEIADVVAAPYTDGELGLFGDLGDSQ
jgi:anti-sigma factor RsiW